MNMTLTYGSKEVYLPTDKSGCFLGNTSFMGPPRLLLNQSQKKW